VLSLDSGWHFHLGDVPTPEFKDQMDVYSSTKSGNAAGAAATNYDEIAWGDVNVPHDWVIEEPFDRGESVAQGYRARGIAFYPDRRGVILPRKPRINSRSTFVE